MVHNHKAMDRYVSIKRNNRNKDHPGRMVILWGPTGSGKTRTAMDCEDVQVISYDPKSGFFSTAWNGAKRVLLDEIEPDKWSRTVWLNITDLRFPVSLNIKGSSSTLGCRELYITSQTNPDTWRRDDVDGGEAWRRRLSDFGEVHHMHGWVEGFRPGGQDGGRQTVLVVEDDEDVQDVVQNSQASAYELEQRAIEEQDLEQQLLRSCGPLDCDLRRAEEAYDRLDVERI